MEVLFCTLNKIIFKLFDLTLGATTPGSSKPWSNAMKWYCTLPLRSSELLPHSQMQLNVIPWTPLFSEGDFTPLQLIKTENSLIGVFLSGLSSLVNDLPI